MPGECSQSRSKELIIATFPTDKLQPPFHNHPSAPSFVYRPQLVFRTEEERLDVLFRGLEKFRKGEISHRILERGRLYQKWIDSDFSPNVSIRFINDRVGWGVFAEEAIPFHSYIGQYTGIVRENRKDYFAPLNNYCYEYPVADRIGRNFVIDAVEGNFTRFINHSETPNLKPFYAFLHGFYHLIFLSCKKIEPGGQLFYDYGPHYWHLREEAEKLNS